jgi:hypothetical protein
MRSKPRPTDIATDPFRERLSGVSRVRLHVLGGTFEFQCETPRLRRLVDAAFAGLPPHRLPGKGARFRIRLALAPRARARSRGDAPRIDTLSGAGLLCGTTSDSDLAVVSPAERAALVTLSPRLLRFPYHARYELIEFAVYTLAARAQHLVPLHAACVGLQGRGLLLMGESGAGKTTASLHCLLRGLEFVSEDSVFATPDSLLVTGVANFLHVRCDSVHSLPDVTATAIRRSPIIRRRSGVEKFEIDLRATDFRLARTPLKITALVFVSARGKGDGELLTPLSAGEARGRLATSQPYAVNQPGWTTFIKRAAAVPAFELCRGRYPAQAGEALQGLLTRAAVRKR